MIRPLKRSWAKVIAVALLGPWYGELYHALCARTWGHYIVRCMALGLLCAIAAAWTKERDE